MFDKMKQLYEIKKQADQLKKELQAVVVEAEGGKGAVKMTMSGEMKVKSFVVSPDWLVPDRKVKLEEAMKECVNQGLEKAQKSAAEKMGGMTNLLNMLKG